MQVGKGKRRSDEGAVVTTVTTEERATQHLVDTE